MNMEATNILPILPWSPTELTLNGNHRPTFSAICQALKTAPRVRSLKVDFEMEPAEFLLLSDAIAHNLSIDNMRLFIDENTDREAFKNFLGSANRTFKCIEISVGSKDGSKLLVLEKCKGLHVPAKYVKLELKDWEDLATNEFYRKMIEILETTNVDNLEWTDESMFSCLMVVGLDGFKEFCEFLTKHDRIRVLKMPERVTANALPYLVKVLITCKKLHTIDIDAYALDKSQIHELLVALSKSNIKSLSLWFYKDLIDESTIRLLLKMEKLTKLHFLTSAKVKQLLWPVIQESESIRSLLITGDSAILSHDDENFFKTDADVTAFTLRNRKLQNLRVRDLIVLLFNISRDTSSLPSSTTLPRDIWSIIMSFVRVPGVSLDFGWIAQSIFKDSTLDVSFIKRRSFNI